LAPVVPSLVPTKEVATLPQPGKPPSSAPTRSKTHIDKGAKGRAAMRKVALDLGAKKITYCEISEGRVIGRGTVSEVESLRSVLGPEQPPATVAIEAGRTAWLVHDLLVEWNNDVLLVDTTRVKQLGIGQHGRKTDRIDAEVLARAVERGGIPQAHVLSPARRELRRVLAVRRSLVESRASLVTTIRGLVREQGRPLPSCSTQHFVRRVREQKLAADVATLIEPLLLLVETIDTQLVPTEEKLAELCAEEPVTKVLTTAPGVGTVVAAAFISVVDEAQRFRHAHQLESYIGLVPGENSSGGKRRLGAITKKGNGYLRMLLVQAGWNILRSKGDDPLKAWATQVAARRGKRVAVVALARRLVGVLWALWHDGTEYDARELAREGARGLRKAARGLEQQADELAQTVIAHSPRAS
jgi:transposase